MSLIIICVLIRYFQNIVDSIMDTEAEDSCETDLEAEVDKEIKEEEIVIILCIYSLIKSIKLHETSLQTRPKGLLDPKIRYEMISYFYNLNF